MTCTKLLKRTRPVEVVLRQSLRLHHENRQELGVDVLGLPQGESEIRLRLQLLGQRTDVPHLDAELLVAGTVLGVVGSALLIAEGFELLEDLLDCHVADCNAVGRVLRAATPAWGRPWP